jgi:hypothetical protein
LSDVDRQEESSRAAKGPGPEKQQQDEAPFPRILPFKLSESLSNNEQKHEEVNNNNKVGMTSVEAAAVYVPPTLSEFDVAMGALLSRRELASTLVSAAAAQHTNANITTSTTVKEAAAAGAGDDDQDSVASFISSITAEDFLLSGSDTDTSAQSSQSSQPSPLEVESILRNREVMTGVVSVVRDIVADAELMEEARRRLYRATTATAADTTMMLSARNEEDVGGAEVDSDEELDAIVVQTRAPLNIAVPSSSSSSFTKKRSVRQTSAWLGLVEDYQCGICRDLLACPKLADCSHSFCGHCIDIYMDDQACKHPSHDTISCPLCRQQVRTCTFERVLDRDVTRKVEAWLCEEGHEPGAVELADEWRERREQYHALELARKASGAAVGLAARRERLRTERVQSLSFFDQIFGDDLGDEEELEEELERMYEAASRYIIPLSCAVVVIVLALRSDRQHNRQQ